MFQVLIDSLIRAAELSFLAVGLTMVYSVLRFPNFAHVEFATVGAYMALLFSATLTLPLWLAAAVGLVLTGILGVVIDRAIFSRLRRASPIMLMIASFALGIAMRETVRAIWGPSPFFYNIGLQRPMEVMGARITSIQIAIIGAAVVAMAGFHLLLNRTRLGIAMRAAADNSQLAQSSGIYTENVIRTVWFIGAAFAALGGVLIALNTQLAPDMGFGIIIQVFAAAILGGVGNPYGALLGAVIIGLAENVGLAINWAPLAEFLGLSTSGYLFIPTGYKAAIPFTVLILVLLFMPSGLTGARR
ncbi:branched-chain amino acid ABC transporter permease [Chelativorans xinjiangense]|uniref:branched-chain amino acid ABC transporter permease n=1 Tax=Chelativorans xinjiangense TaxID=2681485 RepID=UPI00135B2229|nr:branched-chain amino acid ABC transporter permease [Chelativorans xinjiangense]